jgi:hypothetical protein
MIFYGDRTVMITIMVVVIIRYGFDGAEVKAIIKFVIC